MKTISTHYIDGAFVESHGRDVIDVINPTNEKVIAPATLADGEDTRRAIAAAKRAFATYGRTKKDERAKILRRLKAAAFFSKTRVARWLMKAPIIYQDIDSAIRANATLHSLKLSPSVTAGWEVLPWRMDMLKFPAAATEALIEARDAHLMLFAGGFPGSLPVWLLDWLARWAGVRQIKDAALAATAGTNGGTPSMMMRSVLRQFALEHGLPFIIGPKVVHEDERQFFEEETNKSKVQPRIQFSRPIHTPLFESHQHWV